MCDQPANTAHLSVTSEASMKTDTTVYQDARQTCHSAPSPSQLPLVNVHGGNYIHLRHISQALFQHPARQNQTITHTSSSSVTGSLGIAEAQLSFALFPFSSGFSYMAQHSRAGSPPLVGLEMGWATSQLRHRSRLGTNAGASHVIAHTLLETMISVVNFGAQPDRLLC